MSPLTCRRFLGLAIVLLLVCACASTTEESSDDALAEKVSTVEASAAALTAKRERLEAMVAADEGDEAERKALADEITAESDTLSQDIVNLINGSGMIQGEPLSELQQRAVRLKSAEEMYVARQYIDNIGNYERAIAVYEDSLQLDPDNPEVLAALEEARQNRYMTAERFALAKKSMSDAEVLELLGPARPNNIKEFTQDGRQTLAWLYPREDGGAAGVWFEKIDGAFSVYKLNYDQQAPGS